MTELKQNKKPVKFDFKNLTKEQKEKGIGYSFVGLVVIGFFVYGISNYTSDEETTVDEFTTPQSELTQYNNKTDAINKKAQDNTSDGNLAMQFSNDSTKLDHGVNFDALDQQIANAGNNSGSQPTFSPAPSSSGSSGSSNHNQHSTYGDYSMWQAEEPKNNSVGYTNTKGAPITTKKRSADPVYTEIPTSTYQEPTYQAQSKDLSQGKQIRAKLISQGYATPGRSISFVLLEATKIGNENVPKGQVITGVSSEENNRLMVNFSSIKVKNKIIRVQMQLFGSDGMAGLPVSGSNSNNVGNEATSRGKDMVRDQVNRIPVIGGIISSAVGSGNRTADNKIKLSNNIECIIVNYN